MKEVIVDGHVLDKKILRFLQIRPQLAVTAPAKSGLKRKIENLEKWASKMSSILSARNSIAKTERDFCSSSRDDKKTLSYF